MIKKLILAFLFLIPMSIMAQKFGVVDEQAILQNMPELKTAEEQLNESSKTYENELANLKEELNKKLTEYQALMNDPNALESIKERRVQELNELDQKIQQFQNTAYQELQALQQRLMAPIRQKLMDAINAVGVEGSYTFIFPLGLAYYQGTTVIDATAEVKQKLGIN